MMPITLEGGVVAAAEETLVKTSPVTSGQIMTVLSALARDKTNAIATRIEIGVLDGSREIPFYAGAGSFAALVPAVVYWPCLLMPGQAIYARFLTPTAGDLLEVVAHGFVEPLCGPHDDFYR